MAATPTNRDNVYASLVSGGYGTGSSESITRMERKRLLAATAQPETASLSLADLYKLAGERPRLN